MCDACCSQTHLFCFCRLLIADTSCSHSLLTAGVFFVCAAYQSQTYCFCLHRLLIADPSCSHCLMIKGHPFFCATCCSQTLFFVPLADCEHILYALLSNCKRLFCLYCLLLADTLFLFVPLADRGHILFTLFADRMQLFLFVLLAVNSHIVFIWVTWWSWTHLVRTACLQTAGIFFVCATCYSHTLFLFVPLADRRHILFALLANHWLCILFFNFAYVLVASSYSFFFFS